MKRHKLRLSLPQRQRSGAPTRNGIQLCIPRLCAAGKTGGTAFPKRLISAAPLRPCPSPACTLRRLRQRTQVNLLHSMSETIDHPGHVALHGGALFRRYRSESNNHVRVEQPAANVPRGKKVQTITMSGDSSFDASSDAIASPQTWYPFACLLMFYRRHASMKAFIIPRNMAAMYPSPPSPYAHKKSEAPEWVLRFLAAPGRLELSTLRLTAACSTD